MVRDLKVAKAEITMASDTGITEFYRQIGANYVSSLIGHSLAVHATFDGSKNSAIMLSVMCWGNDSNHGIGSETYLIRAQETPVQQAVGERHTRYLLLAYQRMRRSSPKQEPHIAMRSKILEALEPICPPQP